MTYAYRAALALLLALILSGCGQSGPLYIPGNPSTVRPSAEEADTARAEEEEDDAESDASQ